MDIVLFGVQGSGKGTQGKLIASKYDMKIFETGGELRKLSKLDTPLAMKVKAIINAGYLVPNEVVMEIIENFLNGISSTDKVLFDGLPRTLEQMESFNALMKKFNRDFRGVHIFIPKEMAMERLLTRTLCSKCKTVYPATYTKSTCELDNEPLIKRDDDNADSIRTRLSAYENETIPVINTYSTEQKMLEVDGTKSIDEVSEAIYSQLERFFTHAN